MPPFACSGLFGEGIDKGWRLCWSERMPLFQIVAALGLFVLGLVILIRRMAVRWRAGFFCGVAAFWFWSTAIALATFAKAAGEARSLAEHDPARLARDLGSALIGGASGCMLVLPLLVIAAVGFLTGNPSRATA